MERAWNAKPLNTIIIYIVRDKIFAKLVTQYPLKKEIKVAFDQVHYLSDLFYPLYSDYNLRYQVYYLSGFQGYAAQ